MEKYSNNNILFKCKLYQMVQEKKQFGIFFKFLSVRRISYPLFTILVAIYPNSQAICTVIIAACLLSRCLVLNARSTIAASKSTMGCPTFLIYLIAAAWKMTQAKNTCSIWFGSQWSPIKTSIFPLLLISD